MSGELEGVLLDELEGNGISFSFPWRDKTMSGVDDDIDSPRRFRLLIRCSSSFLIPGNGNNLASWLYLVRSRLEASGIGETPVLGGVGSANDCIDAEADEDCITVC